MSNVNYERSQIKRSRNRGMQHTRLVNGSTGSSKILLLAHFTEQSITLLPNVLVRFLIEGWLNDAAMALPLLAFKAHWERTISEVTIAQPATLTNVGPKRTT